MPKLEAGRRADELLEVFDLTGKAKSKPNRLSGGMRRRLLIARALVQRPFLCRSDGGRGRCATVVSHLYDGDGFRSSPPLACPVDSRTIISAKGAVSINASQTIA
jgi:hypothetical protein